MPNVPNWVGRGKGCEIFPFIHILSSFVCGSNCLQTRQSGKTASCERIRVKFDGFVSKMLRNDLEFFQNFGVMQHYQRKKIINFLGVEILFQKLPALELSIEELCLYIFVLIFKKVSVCVVHIGESVYTHSLRSHTECCSKRIFVF